MELSMARAPVNVLAAQNLVKVSYDLTDFDTYHGAVK